MVFQVRLVTKIVKEVVEMIRCDVSINVFLGGVEFKRKHGEKDRLPTSEEVIKKVKSIPKDSLLENVTVVSIEKG